ncbi:MAG: hypothetical protein A2451_02240 [Bdellovibrionales bacterium RIFOXYC2_FULL_39_8]|nr:MAG: hypothetical protein A2451_02240 [Bdellovibrionales bacterium RIFOXYC2_FULL_39_8]
MDHHYNRGETGISDNSFARSIIGGNRFNPTLTIFKHNGYQVDYLLQNSHDLLNDHPGQQIDFTFFGKNEATAAISLFRSKLLKKIYYFFWENRPSVSLAKDEFINKIKKRIDDASNERPTFYFIKAGAAHSVKYSAKKLRDIGVKITDSADTKERPWIYLDYWIEEYRKIYRHAEDELLDLVTHIIDKDNSAVIIALGDHGSFRYRGLPSRNLSIDKMRKEMNQHGVDEQLITEDMFGVFCAIRWPRPAGQQIREISILSNVNIFKYLFSELAQQPDLLSTMAPNISYASAKHGRIIETVREGTPLLNWKEVDKTKLPH